MVLNIALAPPATSELGCGGRFSDDSQSFPGSGRTARRPGVPGWRRGATLLIRGERKSRFGHHNLDNIQSVRHPYLSHYYYIADCSSHPEARLQLRSLCVFRSSLQMFHIHVLTVSFSPRFVAGCVGSSELLQIRSRASAGRAAWLFSAMALRRRATGAALFFLSRPPRECFVTVLVRASFYGVAFFRVSTMSAFVRNVVSKDSTVFVDASPRVVLYSLLNWPPIL